MRDPLQVNSGTHLFRIPQDIGGEDLGRHFPLHRGPVQDDPAQEGFLHGRRRRCAQGQDEPAARQKVQVRDEILIFLGQLKEMGHFRVECRLLGTREVNQLNLIEINSYYCVIVSR